ncbi:MAG TPA: UDP-glucose 4-epimerase GalE [Beijerinckiaceae bacterium]|nr:UDP-glucose 4-epimerase GalE [Beijerinckiaceae bacterium]
MTVLVTGGAGYIGSHMVHALRDRGERVAVLDNLSTGFAWAVPPDVAFFGGDVADQDLVKRIIRDQEVTAICHFAAKIVVPDSVADPLGYYAGNTMASRNLIDAAIKAGVNQFIFSSTAATYGEPEIMPVSEDTPQVPCSPYGRSKLMTEWMLEDSARAYDFRYVALRYFNVAGADPFGRTGQSTPNATHLIKAASQAAIGLRKHLDLYGTDYPTPDGTCVRDYIQVSDLADAHVLALNYLRSGGISTVFNCGYGKGFSVREVIDMVKKVSGVDFPVNVQGRRAGDAAAIVAKADSIRQKLGWMPKHDDLEEIVRQALRWEQHLRSRNAA